MRGPKPPPGLIAAALAVALVLGAPGMAPAASEGQAKEKLREGAARIMEAIDEDGNIIIPRRGSPLDQAPKDPPEQQIEDIPAESTST